MEVTAESLISFIESGKLTKYKEIENVLYNYKHLRNVVYENIKYIDFVGNDLVQNNQSNDCYIYQYINSNFNLKDYVAKFPNLESYNAALGMNNIENLRFALSDEKARYIFIKYYDKIPQSILWDLLEGLKLRIKKWEYEFTFVFEYQEEFKFCYKNGVLNIIYWHHNKFYIPNVLSILNPSKIVNLWSEYFTLIKERPKINTLIYSIGNLIEYDDKIPKTIKYILYNPDFEKYGDSFSEWSAIDNYKKLYKNIEVIEYPVYIREETRKLFPNVKIFHSVYEYLLKKYEYTFNKYNRLSKDIRETDTYKHYMKLYQKEIAKGKEFGVEVYNYLSK